MKYSIHDTSWGHNLCLKHFLCWYPHFPNMLCSHRVFIFYHNQNFICQVCNRDLEMLIPCGVGIIWDYLCGCHLSPCKHDICIWVTSNGLLMVAMRVFFHLHLGFYKRGLINWRDGKASLVTHKLTRWKSFGFPFKIKP
jgi:hypothetical protein